MNLSLVDSPSLGRIQAAANAFSLAPPETMLADCRVGCERVLYPGHTRCPTIADTSYAESSSHRNSIGNHGLRLLSEQNRAGFKKHEEEFQKGQTWPGFKPKPKPTEPAQVLEAR